MRVIGGMARGQRLIGPRSTGTRPTSDLVREALFDVIGPSVAGTGFLDLYAGTGAVGIEALSRGARRAVFVEKNRRQVEVIRDNLARTRLAGRAEILPLDVARALAELANDGQEFEFVFMDPPYRDPALPEVVAMAGGAVAQDGWLLVEHSHGTELPPPPGFGIVRRLRYGDTGITIFQRHREAEIT